MLQKISRKVKLVVSGVGIVSLYILGMWLAAPQQASYSELNWDQAPSVLVISPVDRDGYSGTLFVRLKDGLEQFIPGTWETNFSAQGNVYVFGAYPEEYPIEPKKKLYEIFQGESILDIDLTHTDGDIRSVQENTLGTYLLVKIEKNQTTYFCIAERVTQDTSECDELNLFGGGEAVWDPLKEHEVVVRNAAGEILTYDPWNPGLSPVTAEEAPDQYAYLLGLFTEPEGVASSTSVFHLLHWTVGMRNNIPFFYSSPLFSGVKLLNDAEHALVVGRSSIDILELDTGKIISVYTDPDVQSKQVKFSSVSGQVEYL